MVFEQVFEQVVEQASEQLSELQPAALFWTPYADWIYTIVSTTGLLVIVWLVLRPRDDT